MTIELSTTDDQQQLSTNKFSVVHSASLSDKMNAGQYVILELPSGLRKVQLIAEKCKISVGRAGSFDVGLLIGMPYGLSFEVMSDTELRILTREELNVKHQCEAEEFEENNQHAVDDSANQRLSHEEILQMKEEQRSSDEIIKAITENNIGFEKKTDFAKSKYVERKKSKFSRVFKALKPSCRELAIMYSTKNPQKIRYMRFDTLAYMMTVANVCAGGKFLVVDDCSGLLMAATISRMAGSGWIFGIAKNDTASSWDILRLLGIKFDEMPNAYSLNWQQLDLELFEPSAEHKDASLLEKQRHRYAMAKQAQTVLKEGKFDALLISSGYHPREVVKKFLDTLSPSRKIVIHNNYLEPLLETYSYMRSSAAFIDVQITENWLREYQVLPSRTHPLNNMSAQPGFILQATKILVDTEETI